MQTSDTVLMPRFILTRAAAAGVDPQRLARAAGLPGWQVSDGDSRVSSELFPRLWELFEHETGDPGTTLRTIGGYRVGEFGLVDYLVSSADTLGEGLAVAGPYVGTASTNYRFEAAESTETEANFELFMINGAGRGRDLAVQAVIGVLVSRIRQMTGRPIDPVRVAFRERAPRDRTAFTDAFGSARVDFGAPIDTVTFRTADFDLRQVTGDRMLAAVLRRHAATMPPPPPRATEWPDRIAGVLAQTLTAAEPSLDQVARRLFTSPRTLQRRLHESGTTWTLEVDRARKLRAEQPDSGAAALDRIGETVSHDDLG